MPPCYRLAVSSATAGTGGAQHRFHLDHDVVLVRPRPRPDPTPPPPEVGGVHLRLERAGGEVIAIDGGAKGGTRVGGDALPAGGRRALADGDVIEIAALFRLRFV